MANVENAINMLKGAVMNCRIYPPRSNMVRAPVEATHQTFMELQREFGVLTLSDVQGKLMFNQNTEVRIPSFRKVMETHNIQVLSIQPGLTADEVGLLAEGLSKSPQDLQQDGGFNAWLTRAGVTHVRAEQVQFVAVRKGEDVAQQIKTLFNGSESEKMQPVVASLLQALKQSTQADDESTREAIRQKIINDLRKVESPELFKLLETDNPGPGGYSDIQQLILKSISPEKTLEVLDEAIRWRRERLPNAPSSAESAGRLQRLQSLIQGLIEMPNHVPIPMELLQRLAQAGLVDAPSQPTAPRAASASALSPSAQVEQLLQLPASTLLSDKIQDKIPALIKTLAATNAAEPLERLARRLTALLQEEQPSIRAQGVVIIRRCQETVSTLPVGPIGNLFLEAIVTHLDIEPVAAIYKDLRNGILFSALRALERYEFAEAERCLSQVWRHAHEENPPFPGRVELAREGLQQFAKHATETLSADILSGQQEREKGAYRLMGMLGEAGWEPLMQVVRTATDKRIQQTALAVLRPLDPALPTKLIALLNNQEPALENIRVLTAIQICGAKVDPQVAAELIKHPDPGIRHLLIRMIDPDPPQEALKLWVWLTQDADVNVQLEAVRWLKQKGLKQSAPSLLELLPSSPPAVQEEIVLALGNWKVPGAIPVLEKLMGLTSIPFLARRKTSDAVAMRCVWALMQFLPDPGIVKFLNKVAKKGSPAVRRNLTLYIQQMKAGQSTVPSAPIAKP